MPKFGRLVRLCLVFIQILSLSFGNTAVVLAIEASPSANLQPELIPVLSLPFTGSYSITKQFGDKEEDPRLPPLHNGVDFALDEGTRVLAVDAGEIIFAGEGDFGITVKIKHSWGESVYGHLSSVISSQSSVIGNGSAGFQLTGQQKTDQLGSENGKQKTDNWKVSKGDVIALSGSTGITTGPHLHFGIRPNNADLTNEYFGFIDPTPYLRMTQNDSENQAISESENQINRNYDTENILGEASAAASLQNLLASSSQEESTPSASAQDISRDPNYLFNYKFNLSNGNSAHFYDKATQRASFAIADKDYNYKLRFFLKDSSNSATPKLEGNKIEFPVEVSGIPMTLRYEISEDRVKEEFIISENPFSKDPNILPENQLKIPFDLSFEGLTIEKEGEEYIFRSEDGSIYWQILAPTIKDTTGYEKPIGLEVNDSSGEAILTVDSQFLKEAVYPVVIDPTVVINTSSDANSTRVSTMRNLVRTSDGTLHAFFQTGTQTATCGGSSQAGLLWFNSTDSGVTWTCQGQLTSTTAIYPSAVADSSDNIYVVYSKVTSGSSGTADIFYRKLTKGAGTTWTLESQQQVLDASSSIAYTYATIALEGTTRIWLALRYFDGTNYQVTAYYSNGLGAAPTWTQSVATMNTAGTSATYHIPVIVRYSSSLAVIYNDQGTSGDMMWRNRADSDGLTSWNAEATINTTFSVTDPVFSAAGNSSSGDIYLAVGDGTTVYFTYYNGTSWSALATVSSSIRTDSFVAVETNNTSVWVVYGDTTGINSGSVAGRMLVYKKGVSPFATANFDSSATNIVSHHGTFTKYWSYVSAAYTDDTTDADDTGTADVQMVTGVDDIAYFGKSVQFDALAWDLSTNGAGGVVAWEYCSAVDGSSACTTWSSLSFTASNNTNFTADGDGSFSVPGDWVTAKVNSETTAYYYIRARTTTGYTTSPVGAQIVSMSQIDWGSVADSTAGLYVVWTENDASPYKVRYQTAITHNATPSDPSSLGGHVSGSFTSDSTPTLTFTTSDPDAADTVKYQIQIDDSSDFSSAVVDYTSALAAQGSTSFTVSQAAGSGSYTTGSADQTLSDASYYWRVRITDSSSATSGWSTANSGSIAFKVDTTAPSAASGLTSSSHTASTYSADSTVDVSWTASTDGGSGIAGYSYTFDTTSGTTPDTTSDGASTSTTSSSLSDGTSHYFHVRAIDNVDNAGSAVHLGPFYIDTTGPSTPGTPSTSTPTSDTTPTWSWTASTDSGSGLASSATYSVQWCTDSGFSGCSSNTSTTTTNSFTHSTALADGTWYVRIRATDDLGNNSSYSSNGTVVVDSTSPNSIDLQSPDDKAFTSNSRPTFKWKAASTGDATSGLSKYKFHIDNGTGGDIDIDAIPVSRTTDYTTDKYVISYENFSDSDSSNNYISLYTKSSSLWSSGENDGKLREGKRTWQVTAVDSAGNTYSSSRTLYADFSGPALSSISVDNITDIDGYLLVTANKPKITGKITDNLAYSKLELNFEKENYLLGILISKSSKVITHTFDNSSNATSLEFSFLTDEELDYGKYKLAVYGVDKAGHKSEGVGFDLHLLTDDKAKELLALKDKSKLQKLKEKSQTSLKELEKKAIIRIEKQQDELEKLVTALSQNTARIASLFEIIFSEQGKTFIQSVSATTGSVTSAATGGALAVSSSVKVAVNVADTSLTIVALGVIDAGSSTVHLTTQLARLSVKYAVTILPGQVSSSLVAFYDLNKDFNDNFYRSQTQVQQQIVGEYQKNGQNLVNLVATAGSTVNTIRDGAVTQARRAGDFAYRLRVGTDTFYAIVFDDNPTVITDVTIEEIGPDFAVVSWKTNHFATGKVNYGADLTYGQEVLLEKREKYHTARLSGLEKGKRYFFEVMSQSKTYAYDAYYSFETLE